jgi:8-oxo-dGTP pyrophosphatase MutT (NUDIX family)
MPHTVVVDVNLPSGKLEPGEDVVAAVIREAIEEVGVIIDRTDVRAVHVMLRTPGTAALRAMTAAGARR